MIEYYLPLRNVDFYTLRAGDKAFLTLRDLGRGVRAGDLLHLTHTASGTTLVRRVVFVEGGPQYAEGYVCLQVGPEEPAP